MICSMCKSAEALGMFPFCQDCKNEHDLKVSRYGRSGVVYFVLILSGDPIVKIGVAGQESNSVWDRMKQLQTANPYKLQLMGVIFPVGKTALQLEKEIHADLKEDNVRGEWFVITERMDKWLDQLEWVTQLKTPKAPGLHVEKS